MREYAAKPENKERRREYETKPEVKERARERAFKHRRKPGIGVQIKNYDASRRQKPEVKEREREYRRKPEVKEYMRRIAAKRRKTETGKTKLREFNFLRDVKRMAYTDHPDLIEMLHRKRFPEMYE